MGARKQAEAAAAAAAKKKSWFFGGGGGGGNETVEENREADVNGKDNFLGKVTIEFGQLLSRGCITGDFPIATNGKPLGGTLRLCLRAIPVALDPDRYEGVPSKTSAASKSSPSIARYDNGLAFVFHCDTDKDDDDDEQKNKHNGEEEKTSIAAIKREINGADA